MRFYTFPCRVPDNDAMPSLVWKNYGRWDSENAEEIRAPAADPAKYRRTVGTMSYQILHVSIN